jgi:hypothetical protein
LVIGRFLLSKTSLTGNPYNSSFKVLKPIEILSSGKYFLKFSSYINCPNVECATAKDFMNIIINYENNRTTIYQNGSDYGRFQDDRWIESVVEISIDEPSFLYVRIFSI